ncbi:septum formation initiator [Streptococcus varani]|uniref:Septum formation initiator n=1 Tax=Streptococcus varani TaxID=1608583 RepID=A0A0E4CRZ8_9STRE|nr:septum formation initiator family protein [Streptococcus varani]CQR23967.1 septum formation initiator [Streptococcus varani]
MKQSKVLQINNQYIQTELQKRRRNADENRQKTRFMGIILVLAIFLFVLPTYNLVESYDTLKEREEQLVQLEDRYKELSRQEKIESSLVTKLKDEEYAAKYIRAKLQYSKEGEFIYNIPGLLPK